MIESGFIFQRQLRMSASGNGELWQRIQVFISIYLTVCKSPFKQRFYVSHPFFAAGGVQNDCDEIHPVFAGGGGQAETGCRGKTGFQTGCIRVLFDQMICIIEGK